MTPEIWFITGASSGMGRTMTELVLSQGGIAIATLRKPKALGDLLNRYTADKLLVLKVDVTQHTDVLEAFEKAKETFGHIDVVFNNAGYGLLGEVETTPDEMARKLFETNFWGAMDIARESVKFFREVNKPMGGRLITITSIVAIVSGAALGYYTASKHALEGCLDSMSKELDPNWNIKITNVQPGAFSTRGASPESLIQTPEHPAYSDPKSTVQIMRHYLPNVNLPGDTQKAMKLLYHTVAMLPDPPLRFPLGKDAIIQFRLQAKAYEEDASRYELQSEDLLLEGTKALTHLEEQ